MFPFQDVNTPPRRGFPIVMWGLVLVNVLVFIKEVTLSQGDATCFIYAYSFDPAVLTHHLAAPGQYTQLCQHSSFHTIPAWATIFTAMFLHASILHIGGNMLFLLIFGDNVEDALGHVGFLLFYFVCGVAAALAQTAAQSFIGIGLDTPNLGASGAIAGVLGSYLLLFPGARVRTLFILGFIPIFASVPAVMLILLWFGLQLLNGYATLTPAGAALQDNVAYFAHVGGFIAGFLITLAARPLIPADRIRTRAPRRRAGASSPA